MHATPAMFQRGSHSTRWPPYESLAFQRMEKDPIARVIHRRNDGIDGPFSFEGVDAIVDRACHATLGGSIRSSTRPGTLGLLDRSFPSPSRLLWGMPTFEILTSALDQQGQRRVAKRVGVAAAEAGQPIELVTVVFLEPEAVFVHGGNQIPTQMFARVDVTIGGLDDEQRRRLAQAICELLCDEGVREDAMTLIFRDATAPQVAVGRGVFPFWPVPSAPEA
jgi:phenylpyruvate tautomerase PptA (4-oxalocrotonate tautomerase family)